MQDTHPITVSPKRILVVTLRYLGDTLLTTPLISSLKLAYPNATVDVLTFKANKAMLEGNPNINQVLTLAGSPPNFQDFIKILGRLFRRYDLAISTQASDRPILCAIMASTISLGFVTEETGKTWWKKWLLSLWLPFTQNYDHAVLENLRFCHPLGIKPNYKITPPQTDVPLPQLPPKPYAVLHIMPQWRYKEWHREGWKSLIEFLNSRGLTIVLTGSGQPNEREYLSAIQQQLNEELINLAGQLSLAQITKLMTNATLFVGPDTGITHLAASTGIPTFAILGPTDPQKWAPWPFGYACNTAPFASVGTQHVGNVYLIQGQTDRGCLPCQREGCERHRNSHSTCLDNLSSEYIINIITPVIDALL